MPLSRVLSSLLPASALPAPSSYEQVGHVAHVNLRREHKAHGRLIGEVMLDRLRPAIRTVVDKVGTVGGPYRTYETDLLAGDDDYDVTVTEHGTSLSFDLRRVYWCTRLEGRGRGRYGRSSATARRSPTRSAAWGAVHPGGARAGVPRRRERPQPRRGRVLQEERGPQRDRRRGGTVVGLRPARLTSSTRSGGGRAAGGTARRHPPEGARVHVRAGGRRGRRRRGRRAGEDGGRGRRGRGGRRPPPRGWVRRAEQVPPVVPGRARVPRGGQGGQGRRAGEAGRLRLVQRHEATPQEDAGRLWKRRIERSLPVVRLVHGASSL
ncbi:hypothetical protein THAOC_13935 [Thalassiosira oceanica]|uniref:SAM-dependent methyltransferase TRM5/TYW2-type domain-containing protein n=1 Tax=Thalassiosira oceanica TaxID=159749 RepID=K0SJW8_THAOC|nr:hypothetical protein THAOC_13935 [Thalassiosira oceanica]|eukprot:EJK65234.1 hypothetical protein THAOC_13935 [Thalassiosira oceanica]